MGEVIDFKRNGSAPAGKKKTSRTLQTPDKAEPAKTGQHNSSGHKAKIQSKKKKNEAPNSESIKLWWISQEFDDLIRKAVLDKHIPVEELAAVMAHRLGNLLMVSERTPELTLFCLKIISKITNQPNTGSNAS